MAGGLAAALAGLAHLDSRKHGQQGGGCHSEWTDTVTVHAEGVREACWLALGEFGANRKDGEWGERPGGATELAVEVMPPPSTRVEVHLWGID